MEEFEMLSGKKACAVLTKYHGLKKTVEIPSEACGKRLGSIGAYAFHNCRSICEIRIPDTVTEIGEHAFFDCRFLETLCLSDRIESIGDGAFKNCNRLKTIILHVTENSSYCIKNILSELSGELTVWLNFEDGTACIIIPDYQHDYVENNEARIINQVTYGAGILYREVLKAAEIDFHGYDRLFSRMTAIGRKETAVRLALARLVNPYKLQEGAKSRYKAFLEGEFDNITEHVLSDDDREALQLYADLGFMSQERVRALTEKAQKKRAGRCLNYLLQFKNKFYGIEEKEFLL